VAELSDDMPLHATVEYVERKTNMRFARTYFLTTLSRDFLHGYEFEDAEPMSKNNHEKNAAFLFEMYSALISAYNGA